jgi:hypothetical protein
MAVERALTHIRFIPRPRKLKPTLPLGESRPCETPLRCSRQDERAPVVSLSRPDSSARFALAPPLALATARTAAPRPGQPCGYGKTAVSPFIQEIDLHRTDLIEQAGFHNIGKTTKFKHLVVLSRLIQSHAQRGPPSADMRHVDPNGRPDLLVVHVLLQLF